MLINSNEQKKAPLLHNTYYIHKENCVHLTTMEFERLYNFNKT